MFRLTSLSFITFALILVFSLGTFAQQPTIKDILDRAAVATAQYVDTFRNLLSEESKTIDLYDKKGNVKKKTAIRSTFIVYQLSKDQDHVVEFRNVVAVDGKPVEDVDKRAQDFFNKVVQAESSKKEIDQLTKESARFDGDYIITGLTLFQSPVLAENMRPYFDFQLKSRSVVDGAEVYEITYQQTKESPAIKINSKNEPAATDRGFDYDIDSDVSNDLNGRIRGTLWIDTLTFQVRREHRELTVQPVDTPSPMPVIINDFDFKPSDFSILTPSRITHVQSRVRSKGEPPIKEIEVTMEYTNFSKPDVEIKSSEVKSPPKQ